MATFSFASVADSMRALQLLICVSQSIPGFPVQNCQCEDSCAAADIVVAASAMLSACRRIAIGTEALPFSNSAKFDNIFVFRSASQVRSLRSGYDDGI